MKLEMVKSMPIPPHERTRHEMEEEYEGESGPRPRGPPHGPRERGLPPPPPRLPGLTHEDLADLLEAKLDKLYRELEEIRRRL